MTIGNTKVKEYFQLPSKEEWKWITWSIIIGLFCHGAVIFNNLIFHDDAVLRFGNVSYEMGMIHGRWFFALLSYILNTLAGTEGVSPFFGFVSLFLIALSMVLIFRLYYIQKNMSKAALLLILNTIPYVTSNFGYMSSTIYNFIGVFICICGASMVCLSAGRTDMFLYIGSALMAAGIGQYQCFLPFCASILLLYLIKEIMEENCTEKEYFLLGGKYLLSLIMSLVLYLIILQFSLRLTHTELSSYAGTDTYGIVSIGEYINRFILSYKYFIVPAIGKGFCMFPFKLGIWYNVLLIILVTAVLYILIQILKSKGKRLAAIAMLVFIVFPVALNSNFLLYDEKSVHGLHMYTYMCLYVLLILLLEKVEGGGLWLYRGGVIWVLVIGILYFRYDGLCYLQMDIAQERGIAYFTELKTRIQSLDGYSEDMSVLFLNDRQKSATDFPSTISTSDTIKTNPFFGTVIPNNYVWRFFMHTWTGYAPEEIQELDPSWEKEIEKMQNYPNDGSIRIFDDIIVVKF